MAAVCCALVPYHLVVHPTVRRASDEDRRFGVICCFRVQCTCWYRSAVSAEDRIRDKLLCHCVIQFRFCGVVFVYRLYIYKTSREMNAWYKAQGGRNLTCGTLLRNCLVKHMIEGKLEGRIEMTGKWGRRHKQLPYDLNEKRRYWKLKEEALDRTRWRTRIGRGYGPVVRQTAGWTTPSGGPTLWCTGVTVSVVASE
jgi:hypothetical protein